MDPNAMLSDIRNLIANMKSKWLAGSSLVIEGQSLANAVSDLDEWLSEGGFLPDDWQHNPECVASDPNYCDGTCNTM